MDDDDEPVAVFGDGLMLPRSAARLPASTRGLLREIQEGAVALAQLEAELDELTRAAREVGVSWSVLGFVNGVTGEAVRRRLSEVD